MKTNKIIVLLLISVFAMSSCSEFPYFNKDNVWIWTWIWTNKASSWTIVNRKSNISKSSLLKNKWFLTKEEKIKQINSINSLADLLKYNQSLSSYPKKDLPWFVEIQKKQMLLDLAISEIKKSKSIVAIQNEIQEIKIARSLWPKELLEIDNEIKEFATKAPTLSSWNQWDRLKISEFAKKKGIILNTFYSSKKYKDYINSNKQKIDQLNKDMQKITKTDDIIKMQKDLNEAIKKFNLKK